MVAYVFKKCPKTFAFRSSKRAPTVHPRHMNKCAFKINSDVCFTKNLQIIIVISFTKIYNYFIY